MYQNHIIAGRGQCSSQTNRFLLFSSLLAFFSSRRFCFMHEYQILLTLGLWLGGYDYRRADFYNFGNFFVMLSHLQMGKIIKKTENKINKKKEKSGGNLILYMCAIVHMCRYDHWMCRWLVWLQMYTFLLFWSFLGFSYPPDKRIWG